MSESQSDRFFSMLEHAIVPVRDTKFAEVETLNLFIHLITTKYLCGTARAIAQTLLPLTS